RPADAGGEVRSGGEFERPVRCVQVRLSQCLPNRVHANLTLIPPAGAATPIAREAIRQTDGSWHVNGIDLPEAGSWTVKVLVAVSALGTLPVLDAPVVI